MTLDLQPGELVRLKCAVSLGEMPVVRILDEEILIDTGLRIDGHLVPVGYPPDELIREEDWPALLKGFGRAHENCEDRTQKHERSLA